jgi:hypothetical protein
MNGVQMTQSAGVGNVPANWPVVGTGDSTAMARATFCGATPAVMWRSGDVAIWFMNGTQITQSAGGGNVPTAWSIQGANAD